MRRWLRCALAVLAAGPLVAQGGEPWSGLAARMGLARHPEWLALGHYARQLIGPTWRSFADDPRFFLSPAGQADPAAELAATLEAFFRSPETQCRFVARRAWLAEQMPGFAAALPRVECPEYEAWRATLAADAAVLVFAASYLNSPSSMYGHTFLRFDSRKATQESPLLSYALNFGAAIPDGDNSVLYAWRGLAGGYPGRFAAAPYFEKLREYSRLESRDLWEYRLNLTPGEIDRMLRHVWELRDITFDYYFFDENCSLRLLELLDVARPGHALAGRFPHYAIPVDTVRAVVASGMVADVDYRPSHRAVLAARLARLGATERRLALRLAQDPRARADPAFQGLRAERQRQVAEAAYEYLRHRTARAPRNAGTAVRALELLRLVNELPAAPASQPARPVRPDHGHRTMLLAAGFGTEEGRAFGDFEWRISYHDLLDDPAGHPQGASLNIGRAVARHLEGGGLQLQRLDLVEITSLAPRDEFMRPLSWRVNFGWDRQWTAGDDVLTTQLEGGVGLTRALPGGLSLGALLTGRLEHNRHKRATLDAAPGLAAIATLDTRLGRAQLAAGFQHFVDGTERRTLSLAHDYSLSRNVALRATFARRLSRTGAAHDRVDEGSVALRVFF